MCAYCIYIMYQDFEIEFLLNEDENERRKKNKKIMSNNKNKCTIEFVRDYS